MKRFQCPKCEKSVNNKIGYAFSSWIFPIQCKGCDGKLYLGYHPAMFVLLWFIINPVICLGLMLCAMQLVPTLYVFPALIALYSPFPLLFMFLGAPRLKENKTQSEGIFRKSG